MRKQSKIKNKRIINLTAFLVILIIGIIMVAKAFRENIVFFYSTSELIKCKNCENKIIKLGGMVAENSIYKENFTTYFTLTDYAQEIKVEFKGIVPNLFREKQGIVAEGIYKNNIFIAESLLAKHDENYMPPEIADSLKKQ